MLRQLLALGLLLQISTLGIVETAKQSIQLTESYLPVAMQIIAYLTDQMAYEAKDDPASDIPASPKPTSPTTTPRTTPTPYVQTGYSGFKPSGGWWMSYGAKRLDFTTQYHKPGIFAPEIPGLPIRMKPPNRYVLLPLKDNHEYTVIEPQEKRTEEPLLAIHQEEIKPIVDTAPHKIQLLPPNFDLDKPRKYDSFEEDETHHENLQYLSGTVRDMIEKATDLEEGSVLDAAEDSMRAGPQTNKGNKSKLSASNLRLLLLYDLLSREAKRQKLNNYSGFSPDVIKVLVESSNGGARDQLRLALSKMVERRDCEHEYANNRAKEMVTELMKDESKLSSELRYLNPLMYQY